VHNPEKDKAFRANKRSAKSRASDLRDMKRDNAKGEVRPARGGESGFEHHGGEDGLAGEGADRFTEVFVGAALGGDELGVLRHEVAHVPKVEGREPGNGVGKFEDVGATARSQDAAHFAEPGEAVGEVAQAPGDGDGVEGSGGEGEMKAVAHEEVAGLFRAGLLEHGQAEVGADGGSGVSLVPLQGEEDIAAARGEIEDAGGLLRGDSADEPTSPVEVEASAHDVVHEVVARSDAAKHGGDFPRRLMGEVVPDGGVVGDAGRRHAGIASRRKGCCASKISAKGNLAVTKKVCPGTT